MRTDWRPSACRHLRSTAKTTTANWLPT